MQVSEQAVWSPYQEPDAERFSLKQALQKFLGRARNLLSFSRPEPEPLVREEIPKVYEKPGLTKLSREQASLILLGHAAVGDPGARDLIAIIFPERTESAND